MSAGDHVLDYGAGLAALGPDDLTSIVATLGVERFFISIREL